MELYLKFTVALTLFTVVPTALSIYRLNRQGTSKDLRKKVSKRYLVYFFIYIVMITGVIIDQTGF